MARAAGTHRLPWPQWKVRTDAKTATLDTDRDALTAIRILAADLGFTLDEQARCATVANSLRRLLLVDGTVPVITSSMHVTPDAYGLAVVVTTPLTITEAPVAEKLHRDSRSCVVVCHAQQSLHCPVWILPQGAGIPERGARCDTEMLVAS